MDKLKGDDSSVHLRRLKGSNTHARGVVDSGAGKVVVGEEGELSDPTPTTSWT